jgi:copper oxidase (laccase) domain-containing protein
VIEPPQENAARATTTDAARSFEQFPALSAIARVSHGFTLRVAGIDVAHEKPVALRRLDRVHQQVRAVVGVAEMPFVTAQQVHGSRIAVVSAATEDGCLAACDGLVTDRPNICLGIYVADCCAVYLVDPVHNAIGLVHSGRKGTTLGVVANAIETMVQKFGTDPADLVVQLSPCIRPPHYEIDFAAEIVAQCRRAGVRHVHDSGICTACDTTRYYSYRAEKGRTGRMLALFALPA